RSLALVLSLGLLFEQFSVCLKRGAFVGVERILADLLEPRLHGLRSNLLLVALALDDLDQQSLFAVILFTHLVELLLKRGELVVDCLDGIALGSEVASDDNWRRNEIGLEATLALQVVVRLGPNELVVLVLDLNDLPRMRPPQPAVGGYEIGVVLTRLKPVVHQV